ncbi:allantoate amidohydrolase [Planctobacterium marinum]|uniref:allantoate amidohydrolase n=1 Tax=Planctobacterium marinum TaxID=1631968 RepID=UPI001E39E11A|nr:allantoate amidohydrolase [Planctobacterium marinum]MCC2603979.1 allantoate amidohydrolase [Planctobacterium marinum]
MHNRPQTPDFSGYAEQVFNRCDALALHSQSYEGMDRRYLTPEHSMANLQVAQWMTAAGMETWVDQAGNQWGRYKSATPDAKSFVMGSHIDTVPNGGIYDGILGIVLPISLIQYLSDNKVKLPYHLEIVAFGDEEGTRFGTTLLGSRAITGLWQQQWAGLVDAQGISIEEALSNFGCEFSQIQDASRLKDKLLGFLETHIEQGPVLEAEDLPVGTVSGIAGAKRFKLNIKGHAGHAGTVPMTMRADALVAAAEMIQVVEEVATELGVVATVGKIANYPNAVNVIPGDVEFTLDIRSEIDSRRDTVLEILQQVLGQVAEKRKVTLDWKMTHSANAVACDPKLQHLVSNSISAAGYRQFTLPSGAGHDAMAIADICPVGMLFVRCEKGISHHPAESVMVDDIEAALKVLNNFVRFYQNQYQEENQVSLSSPDLCA